MTHSSFPHFESSAPAVMWMMKNNPYKSVGSPFYPPFYSKLSKGKNVIRGGSIGSVTEDQPHFGDVYHTPIIAQSGSGGLGGFFKGAFKYIKPIVQRGVKALASEGLRSGVDVLNDLHDSAPHNLKQIARRRVGEAGERLKKRLPHILTGAGKAKKRKASTKVTPTMKSKRKRSKAVVVGSGGRKKKTKRSVAGGGAKKQRTKKPSFCPNKQIGSGKRKRKTQTKVSKKKRKGHSPVDIFSSSFPS